MEIKEKNDSVTENLEEKEKILRLAEAWSEEELNRHFRSPIEEIPGFDPEQELEEIKNQVRRAPVYEQRRLKRDLIKEFKKKFISQKQGLAELIVQLEDFIRSNPDAAKDDLLKLVLEKASIYQLNQKQIEQFQKAIDIYYQKHQTILKYVHYYQENFKENWQKEFFKDLYGRYPIGEIDLEVGPVTLCWIYKNPKDGALILNVSEDKAAHFLAAKPIRDVNLKLEGLEDTINALNFEKFIKVKSVGGESAKDKIKRHEEFHNIYDLFFFNFFIESQKTIEYLKERYLQKDIKEEKEFIKLIEEFVSRVAYEIRRLFEKVAKSEILARLKEGGRQVKDLYLLINLDVIKEKLLYSPSYQFFEMGLFVKNDKPVALNELLVTELVDKLGLVYKKFALKIVKDALQKEKEIYKHNVINGLAALYHLAQIHPYDYDRNKLVALLSIEPLAKWPRLAEMFKEIKETN